MSNIDGLREKILEEAMVPNIPFIRVDIDIHSSSTKMYSNIREVYWWEGMKKDIIELFAKFSNCQQVK